MTRQVKTSTYYIMSKCSRVPAKWTSPEALLYKKYSTSSDVWSYGMLMYEIWSLGHKPFEDKTIEEVCAWGVLCVGVAYILWGILYLYIFTGHGDINEIVLLNELIQKVLSPIR